MSSSWMQTDTLTDNPKNEIKESFTSFQFMASSTMAHQPLLMKSNSILSYLRHISDKSKVRPIYALNWHIILPHWKLWWLNLCVNLTRLSHTQIAGKTLFPGVSVRMFSWYHIWVSRKEIHPHQCGQASLNPMRVWRWRNEK